MKTSVVKIGNSRGIQIPKPILEQCQFKEEVELEIDNDKLIVRATNQSRKNWAKAFETMADKEGDSVHFDYETMPNDWDHSEWEWK